MIVWMEQESRPILTGMQLLPFCTSAMAEKTTPPGSWLSDGIEEDSSAGMTVVVRREAAEVVLLVELFLGLSSL